MTQDFFPSLAISSFWWIYYRKGWRSLMDLHMFMLNLGDGNTVTGQVMATISCPTPVIAPPVDFYIYLWTSVGLILAIMHLSFCYVHSKSSFNGNCPLQEEEHCYPIQHPFGCLLEREKISRNHGSIWEVSSFLRKNSEPWTKRLNNV